MTVRAVKSYKFSQNLPLTLLSLSQYEQEESDILSVVKNESNKVLRPSEAMPLSNMVWWKVFLPKTEGWNEMIFKVPSDLSLSIIL